MSHRRVSYIHSDELIEAADQLPANPGRASLVHRLISELGLLDDSNQESGTTVAQVIESIPATKDDLLSFHESRYVGEVQHDDTLSLTLTPSLPTDMLLGITGPERPHKSNLDSDESSTTSNSAERLNASSFRLVDRDSTRPAKRQRVDTLGLEDDCPMFEALPSYALEVAGASLTAARELRDGRADVAIAWTGGRHHGKRGEAAGFCYVQDIVMAILEMRRPPAEPSSPPSSPAVPSSDEPSADKIVAGPHRIQKVMYIDLDVHHGDGVESAFFTSPHTLTVSLHLHAPLFFPASGALSSSGPTKGNAACHALNLALEPGLTSPNLLRLFDSCIVPLFETYQPDAIVVQCGCDGLAGDPVKEWNLDSTGLSEIVRRVIEDWNKPTLLLGGGGYNNANAARCWATLTSAAVCAQVGFGDWPPSLD